MSKKTCHNPITNSIFNILFMEIMLFLQTNNWTPQINPADKLLCYLALNYVVHVATAARWKANGSRRSLIVSTGATLFPSGPIQRRKNRVYSFRPCLSFTLYTRVFITHAHVPRFLQIWQWNSVSKCKITAPLILRSLTCYTDKILWRIKFMACVIL
jgi:hypothetical protein